jgi:hypothetical protein
MDVPITGPGIPDADVVDRLNRIKELAPCGGLATITWKEGASRGMPLTLYCAQPLCLFNGGNCTAPRFVPHPQQYTTADVNDPERKLRRVSIEEILTGVDQAGRQATKITGVKDTRSQLEIRRHVAEVWRNTLAAVRGPGKWLQR